MLTEVDAWTFLAEALDREAREQPRIWSRYLCIDIRTMHRENQISDETSRKMQERINLYMGLSADSVPCISAYANEVLVYGMTWVENLECRVWACLWMAEDARWEQEEEVVARLQATADGMSFGPKA